MSNFKKTRVSRITSVFLGVTTAVWLSGAAALVPLATYADTTSDLQAQIASLLAQISQLQSQLNSLQGGTSAISGYTFATDLKLGSTGADVKNLQTVLNSDSATQVAASGVGSKGNETSTFGSLTKAAVVKFQNKYASEVLTPLGLTAGTGYVGAATRAKLNTLFGGGISTTPTTPGTTPTTPAGTGLTVSAGTQPTSSLFPQNASRVPFTVVNFTASSDGDITVNSLVVERTGLGDDANFDGIVLLDEAGLQLGLSKTLNSLHQATLNEAFVVKAGQTRSMTLAGNSVASNSTRAGQVVFLALVAVNTSATVNGTLPITGAHHTINATLTLGSLASPIRGSLDPGAANTKPVGTNGFTFSSIKLTAGSAEQVLVKSIRWNQSGSAASGDLANIKTYVDGTAYDVVVSSDGKYYTSTLGSGILVDKGASIELSIKGDIVSGSARTIAFDVYKRTDLYAVGATFGYGVTPAAGTSAWVTDTGTFTTSNPWYEAFHVTVSQGTLNVSKATSVAAQNIAVNLANQILGGFEFEVKGESISLTSTIFHVATSSGSSGELLTNISLFGPNGNIVAGPVNATCSASPCVSGSYQIVTFTDTITLPVGKNVYTLKGKLPSSVVNNTTYAVHTDPDTDITSATGVTTGVAPTITPTDNVTANTMTAKSGTLSISTSPLPLAQSIIAGTSQFLFANYILDAGASGEDVALNSLILDLASSYPTFLSSCTLYDGSTVLSSGKSPTAAEVTASAATIVLDNTLVIPKGTSKTISLKCDVAGSAAADYTFAWGWDATAGAISPTGKTSGQTITDVITTSTGQIMTVAASGTYTVADDSTAGYTIVSAGTTGVTLLRLKFAAVNEDINITRVNFELGTPGGNTPNDLVGRKVTLYDAANPTVAIGYANFSLGDYATSTLIDAGAFKVLAGGTKTMLVKGDIAAISGSVGPLTASGDLLKVAYDANDGNTTTAGGNYGKGASSGVTISPSTTSDVTPTGVKIMKSYPTFAKDDLSTSQRILQTKSGATLYRFKVTANGGDVYAYRFTFTVGSSTVSATTSTYGLYAFTDSTYSVADTSYSTDGLLNYGSAINASTTDITVINWNGKANGLRPLSIAVYPLTSALATTTYKIPSGLTRYFEFRANVATVESGTGSEYVTVQLEGDAVVTTTMKGAAEIRDNDTYTDFIWSPNSTSSSISLVDNDFINGYGLTGLPSTSMLAETLTSAN